MGNSISNISKYNLIFIFISIIWQPLQVYYLHVDGAGRTIEFLALVALMVNVGKQQHSKSVLHSSGFVCWTILILYSIVNSLFKGYISEWGGFHFFRYHFLEPFVFLWIIIVELTKNKERCLHCILTALLLYLIMGSTHFVFWEKDENRIVAEGVGNLLPLRAVTTLFVASVLFVDRKLKGNGWSLLAIVLFSLYIIIVTSTRKALGASTLILTGVALGRLQKFDFKVVVLTIVLFVIGYKCANYIIDNTYMGQRFVDESERYDVTLSNNPKINDFLMVFLGDRSLQYYEAIQAHRQAPITGIGIGNFSKVTGFPYVLHSEYMVHYCENGLIGFFLLLIYYLLLLIGFRKIKKRSRNRQNIIPYLFGLLAVLFLNFTAWTYSNTGVMIIYAIILTQIYSKELRPGNSLMEIPIGYPGSPTHVRKYKGVDLQCWNRKPQYHRGVERPGNLLTVKIEYQPEVHIEEVHHPSHCDKRNYGPGNLLTVKGESQHEKHIPKKPRMLHYDKRNYGPGNILTVKREPQYEEPVSSKLPILHYDRRDYGPGNLLTVKREPQCEEPVSSKPQRHSYEKQGIVLLLALIAGLVGYALSVIGKKDDNSQILSEAPSENEVVVERNIEVEEETEFESAIEEEPYEPTR